MMLYQLLWGALVIISVVCLVNYSVDFFYYLKNRYCRFHIGRYEDQQTWHAKVEKTAVRWLKKNTNCKDHR